jgi:hypothetical protein
MSTTKDFFVSYTSVDQDWAEWIAWILEQAGYTCVLQTWDFVPGQDFMQQMRYALDSSRQVVAVLSPEYLQSAYAGAELNAALVADPLGNKGTLVPVRVRDCMPGGILSGRIYIDLVGKDIDRARHDLLAGVAAARLGRRADPEEARFARPPGFPGMAESLSQVRKVPSVETPETVNVLYLGSETGAGLDLKGQVKQIRVALSKGPSPKRFHMDAIFDVTTENIFEALNQHRPNIVHFAGKQNGGNVLIRTPSGSITTISDRAFAGLLQSLDSTVVLAIIDTCKSLRCARAVAETVGFAIGVEDDIYDDDAIQYYNVFYRALAAGRSLASACGQATAALEFRRVRAVEIPQLCFRADVNPKSYRFQHSQ